MFPNSLMTKSTPTHTALRPHGFFEQRTQGIGYILSRSEIATNMRIPKSLILQTAERRVILTYKINLSILHRSNRGAIW
jgi:hypothetical protein